VFVADFIGFYLNGLKTAYYSGYPDDGLPLILKKEPFDNQLKFLEKLTI
jgi:hypothetical protein